ncbi:crossover junction endodeoxyribonuclease RuvC [Calderihabitans maritimus]|uniref:Crossover junction endodeoxyribonuclease RuvC n=1 Tax=Calderihabitans maritimus TaxID=1246530 RepID=A0A1Z5HT61_9FIRM|nr:crossover junction endodeoxyribonuclease RuvC [Calderihabitans maritimus]GAW92723.1 Holliday junction resolvase [Calderihabitans maritimus]
MVILGIDPGTAITGYAVIEASDNRISPVDYGCIRTNAQHALPQRLQTIYFRIQELIEKYRPQHCAVEELFFNKNSKTAMAVGQARGVALLAAANANLEIYEYTPLQIKQAVTGYGRADKFQIQQMVKMLAGLKEVPRPDDVADALALTICHVHAYRMLQVVSAKGDTY